MDMGRCPHLSSGYIKGDHAQLDYRTDLRHGGMVRLIAVNNIYEWFMSKPCSLLCEAVLPWLHSDEESYIPQSDF